MIPVLLGRTREHRDAIRSAGGVNLGAELAREVALVVLPLVLLVVVIAILLTG
jgi:hypothetical protein